MKVIEFVAEFDTSHVKPKIEEMNKDIDKIGASVRKMLELSKGYFNQLYTKLGDIQSKIESIPKLLDNAVKSIMESFKEVIKKSAGIKENIESIHQALSKIPKKPKEYTDWIELIEEWYLKIGRLAGVAVILGAAFGKAGAAISTFLLSFFLYTKYLKEMDLIKPLERLGIAIHDFLWPKAEQSPTIGQIIKETYENIADILKTGIDTLKDSALSTKDALLNVGKETFESFKSGFTSAWGDVKKFFEEKVGWIKELFQFSKSPAFSIIYGYGMCFMEAFCKGLKDKTPLLESTLQDINSKTKTALELSASGISGAGAGAAGEASVTFNNLQNEMQGFYDNFGKVEKDAQEKSKTGWKGWADSIMGFFGGIWGSIKGTYEQFKSGFSELSKSWAAGAEKGGFWGGLKASLPGIGSMIGMISQIPQIIKQVWNSIKNFAQGIAKLFGWMTEEEKVQKDVLRGLQICYSDN